MCAERLIPGQPSQTERMEQDLGNYRAALDWAVLDGERVEAGLSLMADQFDLWANRIHWWSEGVARISALLGTGRGSP